jgi:D-alanyl-D-alanine carboxypeptidase/D-alanyl-D-alanine-endopeptidase (penicillin-binding protein 4)
MGKKHHQRGSIEHGLEWIEEYLDDVPVNLKCVDLYDGSGLSPQNSITSKSFTSLINHFLNRFSVNQLKVYIPRAGYEGTVKSLFSGQKPKGSFYLKSGSMNGVLTYTGFFYGSSGNLYSICFMVNRHQTRSSAIRRHFEKICSELYDEL